MVTRSNLPIPPTHNTDVPGAVAEPDPTPATRPPSAEQPTAVSGFARGIPARGPSTEVIKSGSSVAPPNSGFKLPEGVSASDVRAQSLKYGMGTRR
jgi:hypothetical protein